MPPRSVITGKPIPGATGVTLLARLRGALGVLLTAESLTSIAYTVTDLTTGLVLGIGTFPTSSVVDSLVTGDPRWSQDSSAQLSPVDGATGYNFAATLPASLFPVRVPAAPDLLAGAAPAHAYQCDVAFTPLTGQPFRVRYNWPEAVIFG